MSEHDPRRQERTTSLRGVAFGVIVMPPIAAALVGLGALVAEGVGVTVMVVVVVAAAFVLLTRDDPVRRGVGAGMLMMLAGGLLFFGTCFAVVMSGL